MDWRTQAYELLQFEEGFERDPRPGPEVSTSRVLSRFGSMEMSDQELCDWLKDPEKKKPGSDKDGFSILLCGRPKNDDRGRVRANFFNIPFNMNNLRGGSIQGEFPNEYDIKDALEHFQVHVHMGQVIKLHTPHFSVVGLPEPTEGKIPFPIRSCLNLIVALFPTAPGNTVYTAIFDTGLDNFKENLAFTSTYFPSDKTSFGIILGCTEKDIINATDLLKRCGSSRNHQLLLPAVFLELQRQRLKSFRKSHTKDAIELQDNVEDILHYRNGQVPFQFGYRPLEVSECTKGLSKLCTEGNVMVEDLRIALRQLHRLKRHAEEQLKELKERPAAEEVESTLANTRCFLDLFDEIAEDIELVSGAVTVNVKAATTTADEMSRSFSKQDTRWSMGLAFVAMAYLPITALATIFALPVFDLKAQWRDMFGQPANWSESSSSDSHDSGSPSPSSPPVVSIYFTYWISTSLVLTWLTIEVWWVLSSDFGEWRWDRFLTLRQLAQIVERFDEKCPWISQMSRRISTWISQPFGKVWQWSVSLWIWYREERRRQPNPV